MIYHLGQRANDIGPMAVFQERIKSADDNLLAAGNYTGCETIEALKKAAADYRKKMHLDEDMFKECRIYARAFRVSDTTSTKLQGKSSCKLENNLLLSMFRISI
jgi:hypothetical protein